MSVSCVELSLSPRSCPFKSFAKKSNFHTVIFAIIFVTMNGHTSKLFIYIFYDAQTEGLNSTLAY